MQTGLDLLNEWTWGYRAARTLQVLAGLKVFTLLDPQPMEAGPLAIVCGADPGLLEKLLIAAVAMGLLEKDGTAYRNTPISQEYLVEGRPLYQGNIIAHSANVWSFWDNLPNTVRSSKAPNYDTASHRDFILGMHNITMAGRGEVFLNAVDLSNCRSLVDIGGGPGTYSILACQRYPELRAIVFDLPETVAIAREVITQHGLTDRIAVHAGNWETDDFGQGFDAAILSNVLHGPNSNAVMKLKKACAALQPGGLLAVQEFLLSNDKTGPLIPALFNVMVGAYSQDELTAEIKAAGFSDVHVAAYNDTVAGTWLTAEKCTTKSQIDPK